MTAAVVPGIVVRGIVAVLSVIVSSLSMGNGHSKEIESLRSELKAAKRDAEKNNRNMERLAEERETAMHKAHEHETRRTQAELRNIRQAAEERERATSMAHAMETRRITVELERIQEAQRQAEEALAERRRKRLAYPVPEWLNPYVQDVENIDGRKEYLNIGIVGRSGTGKSSMINRLRGFANRHSAPPGQWAVRGVTETTMLPRAYQMQVDVDLTVIVNLWDLPGVGTPRFPHDDYFRTVGLRHFDFVFIICADRFTEDDLKLKDELERITLPFAFVRTKIDCAIEDNENDDGIPAQETLKRIRTDLRAQGIMNPLLVSTRGPDHFDLPLLVDTVHNQIHAAARSEDQ